MAQKTTQVKFEVVNVDGINPDGKSRQELLRNFSGSPSKMVLQFNRGEVLHGRHQLIEVMVNGEKVGELKDEDYVTYEECKINTREGKLNIYEELLDDGTVKCEAEVILVVPYINSPTEKRKLAKRKRIVILCLAAFFFCYCIYSLFHKDWLGALIELLATGLMLFWTFIRDPRKDDAAYQFIEEGKKKKSI